MTMVDHHSRHPSFLVRKYHQLQASQRARKVEPTRTKRRAERLASDTTPLRRPCENGWSTTSRITRTAHGADIASEAAGSRDLIGRGGRR